jgi:hypothetical protein
MTRKEKLEDAFKAYSNGIMSDEQLKLAHDATAELVETMFAMDVSGPAILGYVLQEQSLRSYISARKERRGTELSSTQHK